MHKSRSPQSSSIKSFTSIPVKYKIPISWVVCLSGFFFEPILTIFRPSIYIHSICIARPLQFDLLVFCLLLIAIFASYAKFSSFLSYSHVLAVRTISRKLNPQSLFCFFFNCKWSYFRAITYNALNCIVKNPSLNFFTNSFIPDQDVFK